MGRSNLLANLVQPALRMFGFTLARYHRNKPFPEHPDFTAEEAEIIRACEPYTMTSPERLYSLINSVRYVVENHIAGDVVECGVWRGGSMMAMAKTFVHCGDTSRELYLFDTYDGMTSPQQVDKDFAGTSAGMHFETHRRRGEDRTELCYAPIDIAQEALSLTQYPSEKVHYVQGRVEETVPVHAPETIAILRLDTDWYESTRHELEHLFPRLVPGGVLIIDDYGHWEGCKKAVDEYFKVNKSVLLNRIDYTGRIGIKTA